jgi:hypothetical protein
LVIFLGLAQEVNHLLQVTLGFIGPGHIFKGHPRLLTEVGPGPGAAKTEDIGLILSHSPAHPDKQADQE